MKITLLGDLRKPNVIFEDSEGEFWQLALYVKNFDIFIKKGLYDQDWFSTFSLDDESDLGVSELLGYLKDSVSEKVYRIKHNDLFYSGLKRDSGTGETFPVFSKQFPKFYYTTNKAIEESYHLRSLGYETSFE